MATQVTSDPQFDPGNFDRSEFVAWNSAAGLVNILHQIRATEMPAGGRLSVLAHSMGNIVLDEALHQSERDGSNGNKLVDVAIMSQAAVSTDYFTSQYNLTESIYEPDAGGYWTSHVTENTVPLERDYAGFHEYGQNFLGIGGGTPRFANIGVAAGKILNYYNPDDYALAAWKIGQASKPSTTRGLFFQGTAYLAELKFGNVHLDGSLLNSVWAKLTVPDGPGFNHDEYLRDTTDDKFYRIHLEDSDEDGDWEEADRQMLSFNQNAYEMSAFGASSVGVAVGGVNSLAGLSGVFATSESQNLRNLSGTNSFGPTRTGHSAEFVSSL